MLIASDKYGGVGSDTKIMLQLAAAIRTTLASIPNESDEFLITTLKETVRQVLLRRWGDGVRVKRRDHPYLCTSGRYTLARWGASPTLRAVL